MMTTYPGLKQGHTVASVEEDGSVVCLEDGACFKVYSGFCPVSKKWQPENMVNIKQNLKNPEHPYILINFHCNDQIEAAWIEHKT